MGEKGSYGLVRGGEGTSAVVNSRRRVEQKKKRGKRMEKIK